jgi:hypothetical protein
MYEWQRIHFIDELAKHNIYIETYNPASFDNFDKANEELIPYMQKNAPYDLFMSCDESSILYKDTVERVKKQFSIPTLLICWDNLELPYKQKEIAKVFDLVWLTSWETEYLFKKWGCKTVFQTYAANPYLFKPHQYIENRNVVGFIGTPYGSRTNKINFLTQNGIGCDVFSDSLFSGNIQLKNRSHDYKDIAVKFSRYLRFPIGRKVLFSTIKNQFFSQKYSLAENIFLHKYHSVSFEEMMRLYSSSALSLNISELRDTFVLKNPIHKMHLRTFEIPMSGGLQLTSYNDEIAQYFAVGKEIVLYKTNDELIDKCRFYLKEKNQNVVKNMKLAAYERAKNEHSWHCRFSKVLERL